jgi:hypothetical protein
VRFDAPEEATNMISHEPGMPDLCAIRGVLKTEATEESETTKPCLHRRIIDRVGENKVRCLECGSIFDDPDNDPQTAII